MQTIYFLTLKEIFRIHRDLIDQFGGSYGIRDFALLESSLSQPKAAFSNDYVHKNIHEMTAAYAYHIIKNHAFVDGNKRTGILAALIFLKKNCGETKVNQKVMYKLALDIANSKISKKQIAAVFKNCTPIEH